MVPASHFNLVRAVVVSDSTVAAIWFVGRVHMSNLTLFFTLIFLAHQTMLSLVPWCGRWWRAFCTHRRLPGVGDAAEADLNVRGRHARRHIPHWVPVLSVALDF